MLSILLILSGCAPPAPAEGPPPAAVLSLPGDPYHPLAREIADAEALPLYASYDAAWAAQPAYLLWVLHPQRLSDRELVRFATGHRRSPRTAVGLVTGSTQDAARALWMRRGEVAQGPTYLASGWFPTVGITAPVLQREGELEATPLTAATLRQALASSGGALFNGHGAGAYWRLDQDHTFTADHLPAMPPVAVTAMSCQTARIWVEGSIALAFVDRGAAAYAGFVYSPVDGYFMGGRDGWSLAHTWPEFPIGRAMQVQVAAMRRSYARLPFLILLGDPRAAVRSAPPYAVVEDGVVGRERLLRIQGAPAGVVPVRVPGGAAYRFVAWEGVTAVADGDPFYNRRLQAANLGGDKYLLLQHTGGEIVLRLRQRAPWWHTLADPPLDALDGAMLLHQDNGSYLLSLGVGLAAWLVVGLVAWRRRRPLRPLGPALAAGALLAAAYLAYAYLRLPRVTVVDRPVTLQPLSALAVFLPAACGAHLLHTARRPSGRLLAVAVGLCFALIPAAFWFGASTAVNVIALWQMGGAIYGYTIAAMLALAALLVGACWYAAVRLALALLTPP